MLDRCIVILDRSLKALTHEPSEDLVEHFPESIPLMRVNYAGEIAAQGLYLGAWSVTQDQTLQDFYIHAMEEEYQHLEWCGQRVKALGGRVSLFNPVWFFGACVLGATSQLCGSQYALGFVEETETQVLAHLASHKQRLPEDDQKSRAVVEKMIEEEEAHGNHAHRLGAKPLPAMVKRLMHYGGKILTTVSERI